MKFYHLSTMGKIENLPEIPGYKLEKKLGRGGMAIVYLGVQEVLSRRVAVKVLNPQMFRNKQVVKRFLNEAQTASRLEHPNIVTIHDVGQIEDTCYIVMEYLYESLVEKIKSSPNSRLDPKEAIRILKRMAKALEYAHLEGFIHRDIKPDNIMFRKDDTPVLVDFGIARAVDTDSQLTTNGMIIGTPHYMSPEQCRGEKIDGQTDIYSLGIVLYEMLTGDIPFRADSAAGILVKHIQEQVPQLPPDLVKYQMLVSRMVAKDRKQRVKSGEELNQLIEKCIPRTPLETIEASRPEKWVFQDNGELEDDESTVLTPYKYNQSKSGNSKSLIWVLVLVLVVGGAGAAYYFLKYFPSHQNQQNSPIESSVKENVSVDEREIITPVPKEGNSGNTTTAESNDLERDYRKNYTLAEVYFKEGKIMQAQEKLNQAKSYKETAEVKVLQKQINEYHEQEKLSEFNKYFSKANEAYKKGNYSKAKENIALAKNVMDNEELENLANKIKDKEEAVAQKVKQAQLRKKNDDDAFLKARGSNTPYAYEKYLERFPTGRHSQEAKRLHEELLNSIQLENKIQDDVTFEVAVEKNTIAEFDKYLRKFPLGIHTTEARTKIQKLKEQVIKDTKIKIDVQRINFFESGLKTSAVSQRNYNTRFSKETTRYIYTEIKYKNKLYSISNSSSRIRLEYTGGSGFATTQLKGMIESLQEAEDGVYWRGMGWSEAGKWPIGIYTVTLFIEDQMVSKSQFEIF